MVDRIELVQNDTGPQMMLTLTDTNTGLPLDLSLSEVQLNVSNNPNEPAKAVIPLILGPDAVHGQVMLDWTAGTAGALDTVGSYSGEVQITWPDGRIQTTPTKLKFRIRQELA